VHTGYVLTTTPTADRIDFAVILVAPGHFARTRMNFTFMNVLTVVAVTDGDNFALVGMVSSPGGADPPLYRPTLGHHMHLRLLGLEVQRLWAANHRVWQAWAIVIANVPLWVIGSADAIPALITGLSHTYKHALVAGAIIMLARSLGWDGEVGNDSAIKHFALRLSVWNHRAGVVVADVEVDGNSGGPSVA
jgi:hypothetical protein